MFGNVTRFVLTINVKTGQFAGGELNQLKIKKENGQLFFCLPPMFNTVC